VVIDSATLDDINPLCDLLAILFSQEAEFKADANLQAAGLRKILSNPEGGIILVARRETKIIGMVNLLFTVSTALGAKVAILEDMVVLPAERGRGVGSQLLNAAIDTAKQQNCHRLTLLTDSDNAIAHRFYEQHGFVRSSMLPFRLMLKSF
jgi:GNAT superfamily N-acetyltransferase